MFLLAKPDRAKIQAFIDLCSDDRFSYSDVGGTRQNVPDGFDVDHNRIRIGHGGRDYEKARIAIQDFTMFDMPMVQICWNNTPIEEGRTVAILARHMWFYSLNAARIVYVFDENAETQRFGFAYGTLTHHVETGEERFSVELNRSSGEVWYDLYAFSKPRHTLARLGYPYSRYLQHEFVRGSMSAMKRAVSGRSDQLK